MHLIPTALERQALRKNTQELIRLGVTTCMECGCCVYNCPAGRQLVQAIRMGKALVKQAGANGGKEGRT